jgi:hypothetical protein
VRGISVGAGASLCAFPEEEFKKHVAALYKKNSK